MGLLNYLGGGSVSGGSQSAGQLLDKQTGLSDETLGTARTALGREQTNYGNETGYGAYLNTVAHGAGPSVAERQLNQGLDQGQRQASSLQAGATGAGAALGRYASILGNANLTASTNQSAAVARAVEASQARAQYAQYLGQMANQNLGLYGTALGTGAGLLENATNTQASIEQENANRRQRVIGSLLSAGGGLGAAALTGSPAPLAAAAPAAGAAAPAIGSVAPAGPDMYFDPAAYSAAAPGYSASVNAGYGPSYGSYLSSPYSQRNV